MLARKILLRPLIVAAILVGLGLMGSMLVLAGNTWRSYSRLNMAYQRMVQLNTLQTIKRTLQDPKGQGHSLAAIQAPLEKLTRGEFAPDMQSKLRALKKQLDQGKQIVPSESTVNLIRDVVYQQETIVAEQLESMGRTQREEFIIAVMLGLAFPLASLAILLFLKQRVFRPLKNMSQLMRHLAKQDYRSITLDHVDPLILPLMQSYNQMVDHLEKLNSRQSELQSSLRQQVRDATRALIEQQRSLARAERLAAVGEVAAGLAHELRNPLAGLQVALKNLQSELTDSEHVERLNLMIAEVRRVVQLLNNQLGQARVAPEAVAVLKLAPAVEELLKLLRYQFPDHITLKHSIPPDLSCMVSRNRLHQALLNLVQNSAQAMGDKPGTIWINASSEDGLLKLFIEDNGPGLPEDLLQYGVRPFASWRDEGTGLGLAIVRRFIQDVGGQFQLMNRDEGGARVILNIPCKVCHA